MGTEIEYRFLVAGERWRDDVAVRRRIEQHYLFAEEHGSVRVRVLDGERALVTIKGARAGASRPEYEWDLDVATARSLVADLGTGTPIVKVRSELAGRWSAWVVDEFEGANAGLVIAELEVDAEGPFDRPDWLGAEVTADRRYGNAELSRTPFTSF